jgi:uncharacterized protein DUF4350
MRGRSLPWLLLGAGVVILIAISLFGSQQPPPSTHSSTSDAADGTSALAKIAARGGHEVTRLHSGPATGAGLLFIFSPNQPYSFPDALTVARYVEDGGVAVYANETEDSAIEGEFGLIRSGATRDLVAYPPGPLLPGVHEVSGGAEALAFDPQPNQVPLLRGALQDVLALEVRRGKGLFIAIADPLILCNGYLLRSDNARFIADLLGLAPPNAGVAFDESHHVAGAAAAPAAQPAGSVAPWIAAIFWAVAVLYIGLALRGRAFGPPVPLAPARARSSAEYVDAVSTLLRRSGGRSQALDILVDATQRALRGRRHQAGADEAVARLAAAGAASETELLSAARELHEVAMPERRP